MMKFPFPSLAPPTPKCLSSTARFLRLVKSKKSSPTTSDIRSPPSPPSTNQYSWKDLQLHPLLLQTLQQKGFQAPTSIQQKAFLPLLHSHDTVIASPTGSGKTLSYLLPLLEQAYRLSDVLYEQRTQKTPNPLGKERPVVIVVPTRDLCFQLYAMIRTLDPLSLLSVQSLVPFPSSNRVLLSRAIGSDSRGPEGATDALHPTTTFTPFEKEEKVENTQRDELIWCRRIRWGLSDIVLTTIDPLIQELHRCAQENCYPSAVILDEVDVLFQNNNLRDRTLDLIALLRPRLAIPNQNTSPLAQKKKPSLIETQVVFCGATVPAMGYLSTGSMIVERFSTATQLREGGLHFLPRHIKTNFLDATHVKTFQERFQLLLDVVKKVPTTRTLIFCNSQESCRRLYHYMSKNEYPVVSYHRSMSLTHRLNALHSFNAGTALFMVSTDLGARGIDFLNVDHVINFHSPTDGNLYLHRSGRTGRMNKEGLVTTFVDHRRTKLIDELIKLGVKDLPLHNIFSRKRSFCLKRRSSKLLFLKQKERQDLLEKTRRRVSLLSQRPFLHEPHYGYVSPKVRKLLTRANIVLDQDLSSTPVTETRDMGGRDEKERKLRDSREQERGETVFDSANLLFEDSGSDSDEEETHSMTKHQDSEDVQPMAYLLPDVERRRERRGETRSREAGRDEVQGKREWSEIVTRGGLHREAGTMEDIQDVRERLLRQMEEKSREERELIDDNTISNHFHWEMLSKKKSGAFASRGMDRTRVLSSPQVNLPKRRTSTQLEFSGKDSTEAKVLRNYDEFTDNIRF